MSKDKIGKEVNVSGLGGKRHQESFNKVEASLKSYRSQLNVRETVGRDKSYIKAEWKIRSKI